MDKIFQGKELQDFLLTTFILSLIFFFFKWRNTDLNTLTGTALFISTLLFVLVVTFLSRYFQKIAARKRGYKAIFANTWQGMGITLAISFFSLGLIPLLSPGRMILDHNYKLRIGHHRKGVNHKDMSFVSIIGILTYLLAVIILKIVFVSTENEFFKYLTLICLLLAVFSILPIPTFEGINIFAHSRLLFFFFFVFVITYSAMVLFSNTFYIIIPLLVAAILSGFFLVVIEKKEF